MTKNPITSTTPLDRYPGWTVRRYANGTYDAVNQATAISPGFDSFTGAVGWVREQEASRSAGMTLRKITPTSTAPYRLRFLSPDFPADGALVVEWIYSFSVDSFVPKLKERRDGVEHFVETVDSGTIRSRDFTDERAERIAEMIVFAGIV